MPSNGAAERPAPRFPKKQNTSLPHTHLPAYLDGSVANSSYSNRVNLSVSIAPDVDLRALASPLDGSMHIRIDP